MSCNAAKVKSGQRAALDAPLALSCRFGSSRAAAGRYLTGKLAKARREETLSVVFLGCKLQFHNFFSFPKPPSAILRLNTKNRKLRHKVKNKGKKYKRLMVRSFIHSTKEI